MRLAASRCVTKPTEEEIATRRATLKDFIDTKWPLIAPKAVQPFDENDQVKSQKNFKVLAAALNQETVIGKGTRPVRADVLADIVHALDVQGYLEHFPEVVERVVEVEKKVPLTRKEALKSAADLTRLMNAKDLSPIQGFGVKDKEPQPSRASQAQLEAQATHDLEQNSVMGDINSSIRMHRGKSHGSTDAERKILERIRDESIENGVDNKIILQQIEAKRNEMIHWDAQKAIRIVYTDKFRERGIDLSQRTPSKFGDSQ